MKAIGSLKMSSESVVERAVRSGMWEGVMNTLNRVIQLAKVTILAQLLPPKEFGVLGIGFLTLAVFESFSQLGIDTALIQKEEENVDRYLNTAWLLQIFRGALLACLIFVIAPYSAEWFGEPRATNIIRALGIGPLLLGLKNPGVLYFRKNLRFHMRFVQIMSGTIVNFIIAVFFGIILGNVWALVAGTVAGNIISVAVSFLLHDYRPSIEFDFSLAQELIDFGKWIFGNSITRFIRNQGDDIFVGWFLGATPLAFYQMAYRFSNAPATELTGVISKVTFPSLSKVQDDSRKLRNGYFRTLRFSVFLAAPVAVGIVLVARPFVEVFLGTEWLPTVPVLQVLAVWGALRAFRSGNGSVWNTLSRPDISLKMNLIRILIIAIGIYPAASRFELIGVSGVIVVAGAVTAPVEAYITLNMIDGSVRRYLRNLFHPMVGCGIMAGTLLLLERWVLFPAPLVELVVFVLVGAVTYFLYSYVAVRVLEYRIVDDLDTIKRSFEA